MNGEGRGSVKRCIGRVTPYNKLFGLPFNACVQVARMSLSKGGVSFITTVEMVE